TCAATRTRKVGSSKPESGAIALRPSRMPCQTSPALRPSAQTAPMPVITTRRLIASAGSGRARGWRRGRRIRSLFREQAPYRFHQSAHRLGIEIRIAIVHLDLVVILDLENYLDRVQRCDLQILQGRIERDLRHVDVGFLGDDAEHRLLHVFAHGPLLFRVPRQYASRREFAFRENNGSDHAAAAAARPANSRGAASTRAKKSAERAITWSRSPSTVIMW